MLRNIDPILSPDMLQVLRAMGHGDEIVIADANFPGERIGKRCIRADGSEANQILRAVLSVMPLDTFGKDPALTMAVVGEPDVIPEAVQEFQNTIDQHADHPAKNKSLERYNFYERAENAFALILTGERRLYGNIILRKGVIEPA